MDKEIVFDESSWSKIEQLLPNDVMVRTAVLEDFMWFMGRSKKYKSTEEKIEDYFRHLQLKTNPKIKMKVDVAYQFRQLELVCMRVKLLKMFR